MGKSSQQLNAPLLGLLIAALLLWLMFLGDVPLRDWDEGTRALIGREIYRTGSWLHPTIYGEPYLLKPPLMDWLIALSYKLGGINEFTTRLPGAILSACGVPLLYLLGREVFRHHLTAVFAASVYLTLLPVVRHGRLAMLDGMVNSCFLLLLWCLLKARYQKHWAIGIGISLGLISLTKGLLVLPLGAIAFLFLLIDQRVKLLSNPYLWLGIVLGNLPVFTWYFAQWQHYGHSFWQVHFHAQGWQRLSNAVEGNSGPIWYYLLELLKYSLPWLWFWPGGLYLAWQRRRTSWGCLILIGTIVYLGIISLMKTKLPWYIMPLYPFFAIAVAVKLTQLWEKRKHYQLNLTVVLGLIAVAAVAGCIYFILTEPQPELMVMGLVLAVSMGFATWLVKQNNRKFISVLFIGLYLTLTLLMTSKFWLWELNEAFPVKPVAALIKKHTEVGAIIYTSFSYERPSLNFYSDRRVISREITALQELCLTQPYLLLDQATLEILQLPSSIALGTAEGFTLVEVVPREACQ
ncbi:MAG: glycosyltransferase family 39 protein [Symploca sp. SIO2B6]|nr:glycosyltransferase family 39 protein [Symploca sp. SIO2B6]